MNEDIKRYRLLVSKIMKIIDERVTQKKTTTTKAEKNKVGKNYSETVRTRQFCCTFKLVFLQLICKASLIFKSNLELALLIISKERKVHEYFAVECRCLRIRTCYPF